MAPQLLWIGLGNMGRKGSLGKPLLIYNRTQKRCDEFATQVGSANAKTCTSLQEGVSSSDIIFSCLSSDSAVVEIYESMAKEGDVRGKLFVECSTISPKLVDKIAKLMIDHGAEFVSSPVFGPPQMANSGTLIFATAGAKSSIEKMRPYIKGVMGRDEISFEDEPHSNASKSKLIGNAFALNAITQIAESLTLAEKSGISPATVNKFADIMYGGIYSIYAGRMLSGEYWTRSEPYASADIAMKDIKHLLGLGQDANMEMKNAHTGLVYLQMAMDKSQGDQADLTIQHHRNQYLQTLEPEKETAVPYAAFKEAGFYVQFSTETGKTPECDKRMMEGITGKLLGAKAAVVKDYKSILESDEARHPLSWTAPGFSLDEYSLVLLPGGHDKAVRQIIDSKEVHKLMLDYFPKTKKPSNKAVGSDGKSVLHDCITTTLPGFFESSVYWATKAFLGDYYKTYGAGSENTEDSVSWSQAASNDHALLISRYSFVVKDNEYNYVSARWPGDTDLFAKTLIDLVRESQ
ncbi:6-phosphogluconate dehydrogenase [Fusarium denticulatum]|uniref:6-phosphogluconate dehydrogenase n=1 Tax=Fusarium denticulatum TaxID=48507 RepID=A0A8H5X926_9HYPO|nr:6-phosphogluconate dehydrogenase [Fusarium denticulatum]